ncbi:Hypothetical predicted protein, partial [Marmota monax]
LNSEGFRASGSRGDFAWRKRILLRGSGITVEVAPGMGPASRSAALRHTSHHFSATNTTSEIPHGLKQEVGSMDLLWQGC